jgi:hypothetical protein
MVVKRIFIYLKGTTDFGLWYLKGNDITTVLFIDNYWAGRIDDIRSTIGVSLYLGDCLVS